jgi:hypothetical protein
MRVERREVIEAALAADADPTRVRSGAGGRDAGLSE